MQVNDVLDDMIAKVEALTIASEESGLSKTESQMIVMMAFRDKILSQCCNPVAVLDSLSYMNEKLNGP